MPLKLLGPLSAFSAGPSAEGLGVVPQASVPTAEISDAVRQGFADQEPPPEALPSSGGLKLLGKLSDFQAPPTSVPSVPMAASTIAPKSGTPYQPSLAVDQAHEVYRRLKQDLPLASNRSTLGNIAQSAMVGYANNALAVPSALADVASYPVRRTMGFLRNPSVAPYTWLNPDKPGQDTPVFGAAPRVTVQDIGAQMRALRGDVSPAQAGEQIAAAEQARQENYPIATGVGETVGDVATLASGRLPFGLRPRAYEYLIKKGIHAAEDVGPLTVREFRGPAQARAAASKAITSLKFFRGLNRVKEAGIEGAALGILHNQDPVEAAAFTAGAQGVLSPTTELMTRNWIKLPGKYGKVTSLAVQLGGLSAAIYAIGNAFPGAPIKDYEAQRTASDKLVYGTLIGMGTGMFSARARSGFVSALAPRLADAFGSAPRNVMQSIILDQLRKGDEAGRQDLLGKLDLIMRNADKIAPETLRDLSRAMNANKDRFLKELDKATEGLQ